MQINTCSRVLAVRNPSSGTVSSAGLGYLNTGAQSSGGLAVSGMDPGTGEVPAGAFLIIPLVPAGSPIQAPSWITSTPEWTDALAAGIVT
jgi:hypothetical protein